MKANNKACREALILTRERIVETKEFYDGASDYGDLSPLLATIDSALSAPPRNCDVYNPEEMVRRHNSYCGNSRESFSCINSPASSCKKCFAKWSQMPYEEGDET